VEDTYTGPRTLDGRPAPVSAPEHSTRPKKATKTTGNQGSSRSKKFATLGDLSQGDGHGHSHDDDDDDDEDDDDYPDDTQQDFFTGGEKSGLAVQNPDDPRNQRGGARGERGLVDNILKKAGRYVYSPTMQ
jgi:UBX domain-containing protein 1